MIEPNQDKVLDLGPIVRLTIIEDEIVRRLPHMTAEQLARLDAINSAAQTHTDTLLNAYAWATYEASRAPVEAPEAPEAPKSKRGR